MDTRKMSLPPTFKALRCMQVCISMPIKRRLDATIWKLSCTSLQGLAQNTQPPYGRGDRASFLPWSQENSDAAVGAKKKAMVENKKSEYYQSMPTKVASTLLAATQMVQKYAYSMKPRYDELKQCLAGIELEVPAASAKSTPAKQRRQSTKEAAATPSTETPTSVRRSPRRPLSTVDDQSLRSIKASPAAKRTRKVELVEVDEDSDVVMQDVDSDEDEDNRKPAAKHTAKPRGVKRSSEEQAATVQDVDMAEATVAQPRSRKAKVKAAVATTTMAAAVPSKPATRLAALIKVTDGKHAGEQHWLASDASKRLVVGSAPTGAGDHWTITGDSRIAANHMTLELNVFEGQGKSIGVKVTDLKSADGILFNGKRIASGKNEMAFCGAATIDIGSHTFKVCRE
jgi:hypothetical protein